MRAGAATVPGLLRRRGLVRYVPVVSDSLHPTEGIRVLLDREEIAGDKQSARYRAAVYTVDQCFRYQGTLHMDGSATLEPVELSAAPEEEETLDKIARSTARAARRKLDEALPPWPPRIMRWRGLGRG